MNSILIPRPKPLSFFFFFFFEREERGVFFFLNHYPGNLIHTEYNGKERGRLDRGLEEIMKFVHIQASWKVPPLSQLPPPFSSDCPAPLSHPPTPQKRAQGLLLWERRRGGEAGGGLTLSEMIWFQFVSVSGKRREQMISIFSLASCPTNTPSLQRYLARWQRDSSGHR